MNQKTSKVEKEFYLRCSYLTLSVLFDKEPNFYAISEPFGMDFGASITCKEPSGASAERIIP